MYLWDFSFTHIWLFESCGKRIVPAVQQAWNFFGKVFHGLQMQQSSPRPNLEDLSVEYTKYFEKTLVFEQMIMDSRYRW